MSAEIFLFISSVFIHYFTKLLKHFFKCGQGMLTLMLKIFLKREFFV